MNRPAINGELGQAVDYIVDRIDRLERKVDRSENRIREIELAAARNDTRTNAMWIIVERVVLVLVSAGVTMALTKGLA